MITDLQHQLGIDSTFFTQFGIFLFLFVWLRFVLFKPYLELIQRRKNQSGGLSEEAVKLEEEAARAEAAYQEAIAVTRRKAAADRELALAEARKAASSVVASARGEAKVKLEKAREGAVLAAEAELSGLKGHVGAISSLLMEKLTQKRVGL